MLELAGDLPPSWACLEHVTSARERTPLPAFSIVGDLLDVIRWLIHLPALIFGAYSSLVETVAGWVRDLFERYGYWVVFLGTFCENTLFVGLIIPGVLVIILAGISAEEGLISFPVAVLLGIAGTVCGDTVSYLMGRYGWKRFGARSSFNDTMERIREPIIRRGPAYILLYHFLGYTRLLGPATAGVLHMPYRRWAPFDYAGASLWVTIHVSIGYALGLAGISFDSSDRYFRYVEWGLLVAVFLWIGLTYQSWVRTFSEILERRDASEDSDQSSSPAVK